MRVLHVINSIRSSGGGPIEGIKQLARVNVGSGHTIEVASLDSPDLEEARSFPLVLYCLGPSHLKYAYSTRFVPWLRARANRYDVIVVNGIWQYQCFGTWLALQRSTTPYVVFSHGMLDPWFKRRYPAKHLKKWLYWAWAGHRSLRDAGAVVFTCDEERIQARKSFWLYKIREAVVSYGTAGPTVGAGQKGTAFFARYPQLRNRRLVLFMGRIHEKKGCDLLVRAFARVLAGDPAWRLVIAGPDEVGWQRELESLARGLGIDQLITWTGMVSGEIKWETIRAAEVFVLPSHQENFGIAVAEALACGIPVLISDKVNIWREVREDGAGLVAPDDVTGTCQMLAQWAGMQVDERSAVAANARPCFLRRFEIHAAAQSFIETLTAVVNRQDCGGANSDA